MDLEWYMCTGGVWCDLFKVDLEHKYLSKVSGVFILWTGDEEKSILKIGHGNIATEFKVQIEDMAITAFQHLGVYVSWAEVSSRKRDGIAAYLENNTNPKIESEGFGSSETVVNLPWE